MYNEDFKYGHKNKLYEENACDESSFSFVWHNSCGWEKRFFYLGVNPHICRLLAKTG